MGDLETSDFTTEGGTGSICPLAFQDWDSAHEFRHFHEICAGNYELCKKVTEETGDYNGN